jgi:hypothetical protein
LKTLVRSATRSAAPVTNKSVGAPTALDRWERRVWSDGRTITSPTERLKVGLQ